MAFGTHVICELSDCRRIAKYDNLDRLKELIAYCVREAGLTCLSVHAHKFEPQGISGLAILQESHLSVHVWPELGYAALDVYTCGKENEEKAFKAARHFAGVIDAQVVHQRSLNRGVLSPGAVDEPGRRVYDSVLR